MPDRLCRLNKARPPCRTWPEWRLVTYHLEKLLRQTEERNRKRSPTQPDPSTGPVSGRRADRTVRISQQLSYWTRVELRLAERNGSFRLCHLEVMRIQTPPDCRPFGSPARKHASLRRA